MLDPSTSGLLGPDSAIRAGALYPRARGKDLHDLIYHTLKVYHLRESRGCRCPVSLRIS